MAAMLGSYYDESAVDGGGPVSAIGGLVLKSQQYGWLETDWRRAITESDIGKHFIHMKDFGQHGELASFPINSKRTLLARLVKIINDRKQFSVGSTLTPGQYKERFSFLNKRKGETLSIHTMCFLQAAVNQAKWCEEEGYFNDVPFILDKGCPDREDIDKAHAFLINEFPNYPPPFPTHAGDLTWEDDKNIAALQAADVIAWAVRRRAADLPFNNGVEPLVDIFYGMHMDSHFQEEWMKEVELGLRAKLGR